MPYEDLLLEVKDHIALVTLNQPQKLNALSRGMVTSIARACDDIARNDDVRVVVVTGAGRGFCSGADVSMMLNRGSGGAPSRFDTMQALGIPHADAFPKLNKPVIAAINGPCVGGGFSLALSCDVRIAADIARFGVAQVSRGLVPDYGMTTYLPLVAGISNAFQAMFTAEIFSADRAREMGVVSQVVPLDGLMPTAFALAAKMALNPPYSLALTKKMVWGNLLDNVTRALEQETAAQRICFGTEDHQASVKAFLNKEPPPQFVGR